MPPYTLYKALHSHDRTQYRTPSPPLHAYEFTSDGPPHRYTSEGWKEYPDPTIQLQPRWQPYHRQTGNDVGFGSRLSDHHSRNANHGRMDALAAAVEAVSPTFAVPKLHYGSAETNRPQSSGWTQGGRMPAHTPSYEYYSDKGPPSKRARSEVPPPVQYVAAISRPATSHVSSAWFHNGGQMAAEDRKVAELNQRASTDEAQLLLSLSMGTNRSVPKPTLTNDHEYMHAQHPPNCNSNLAAESHGAVEGDSSKIFGDTLSDYIRASEDGNSQALQEPTLEQTNPLDAPGTTKDSVSGPVEAVEVTSPAATSNVNTEVVAPEGEVKKPRQVGWPKGKPRKARLSNASMRKDTNETEAVKASNTKPLEDGPVTQESSETHSSPEAGSRVLEGHTPTPAHTVKEPGLPVRTSALPPLSRRLSDSDLDHQANELGAIRGARCSSVPPDTEMVVRLPIGKPASPTKQTTSKATKVQADTVCAGCKFSRNSLSGEGESWISCNGCKEWFHFACAGFKSEREVRNVDKFHCRQCKATHGATTFVRKSSRAHTSVDYARLQEGVVTTSSENPEHHYIQSFKEGKFKFQPEKFPRMRPELVTAEYFERCHAMIEPVVIPAAWNPRPRVAGLRSPSHDPADFDKAEFHGGLFNDDDAWETRDYEYDLVPDEGQDKLAMVIPQGLTVRRVAQLYGPEEKVEVIDVKLQEGEDKRWNMKKWADYYEKEGDKVVRNVISLEVSQSKLGRLIRRPKVVRDLDLQDSVWPAEETAKGNQPRVQFYCLMSVADCYTDFHIDFGGSSVYYHILKGKKTFFFIPPKTKHLKKYEDWCLSPAQNHTFLPDQTKECYRVDLSEGDTMLIPSGWIHAVWTPENSLVIGGNFLTRLHYGMQIRVADIEKATKVPRKFRYPHFQKVLWYAVIRYLEEDPLPRTVLQGFYEGRQFHRQTPLYYEFDPSDLSSQPGEERYNARYYPQAELESLPDLVGYIFRTVMISLGKVEGITNDVKNAVTRAIPKGHGEPLELCKMFAMWTAWKRGNEDIPQWAHTGAELPNTSGPDGEKKLSAASLKRLERRAAMAVQDRQSSRRLSKALEANASDSPHLNTTKTSILGPARVACDACRKRRIGCKHKDAVSPAAYGHRRMIKSIAPPNNGGVAEPFNSHNRTVVGTEARQPMDVTSPGGTVVAVVINNARSLITGRHIEGYPAGTDQAQRTPYVAPFNKHLEDYLAAKGGRSRACAECRRSKRRCIHDENGGIDPVKAAEPSVPRGPNNAKKRKPTAESDSPRVLKLPRHNPHAGLKPNTGTNGIVKSMSEMRDWQTEESLAQLAGPSYTPHMGPSFTPNMTRPTSYEAVEYDGGHVKAMVSPGLHEDHVTVQSSDPSSGMPYESHSGNVYANGLVSTAMACLEAESCVPGPLALNVEQPTTAIQQEPTPPEDDMFDDVRDEGPWVSKDGTQQLKDGLPSPMLEQISVSEIPAGLAGNSDMQASVTVQRAEDQEALESGQAVSEPCLHNNNRLATSLRPIEGASSGRLAETPDEMDSIEFGAGVTEPGLHNDERPAMSPRPSQGDRSGGITDTPNEADSHEFGQMVTEPSLHNNKNPEMSPQPCEGELAGRITARPDYLVSQDHPTALLTSNGKPLEEPPALQTPDAMAVEESIALPTVKQEPSLPTLPMSNGTMEYDSDEELSPPSSPLTEMSTPPPSSGTPRKVREFQGLPSAQRHSSRQIKQVERFVNQVYEGSYDGGNNSNRRLPSETHTSGRTNRSISVTVKQPVSKRERNDTGSKVPIVRYGRSRTASTAATDPAEEESLRLAKQLQEHEFGLRRRSK